MKLLVTKDELINRYKQVRMNSEQICSPLQAEDYVVQPVQEVSPPKWHLGHTTWFFETFILKFHAPGYRLFDPQYNYVFNSYYESVGARVIRTNRGNLSRPTVKDIYRYRKYVDNAMVEFIGKCSLTSELIHLIILGFNHEEQHQELLYTDIKYILGHNPLFPPYSTEKLEMTSQPGRTTKMMVIPEGIYETGYEGDGFCWDNELARHKVYLNVFEISDSLVTNEEYLEFMEDGGYEQFQHWHSEGWDWVKKQHIHAPMYWHREDGQWMNYTFNGLQPVNKEEPVCHINFFEAAAFATWKGLRLPTEFEWEVASLLFEWGKRWEWTQSAYLPYPHFSKAPGALGEYNGKFMVNQHVLRGASIATPAGHSRRTYRNFFPTNQRWQFTGIRLAK
ncbi:sulfatase maturase [Niastella yeongjuensis]|uniref:Sulfatase maturase n=1 Tax=Niastella yeongjuensis TaxID=354355 RepID=A0A1V9E1U0_9BACT|nr:ergothioneine biosynthesis protein EgtB [Niastella yeongjuensis]OQP40098.1 sulfatase maturase [Niastella yeongjuensis]SEO11638.1 ergothioneine biosynthesis protein EgtB [Niastella yeongjuensis]